VCQVRLSWSVIASCQKKLRSCLRSRLMRIVMIAYSRISHRHDVAVMRMLISVLQPKSPRDMLCKVANGAFEFVDRQPTWLCTRAGGLISCYTATPKASAVRIFEAAICYFDLEEKHCDVIKAFTQNDIDDVELIYESPYIEGIYRRFVSKGHIPRSAPYRSADSVKEITTAADSVERARGTESQPNSLGDASLINGEAAVDNGGLGGRNPAKQRASWKAACLPMARLGMAAYQPNRVASRATMTASQPEWAASQSDRVARQATMAALQPIAAVGQPE
ncbi:MAG: hypothetical protein SGPRY_011903, partial [Prymnesium sp.]